MAIEVAVLRVFTDSDGNFGNPLGVVDARAVPQTDRQRVAAELGYSETVFIDLPAELSTAAHARIFTPETELPFAGHPTVGAARWLHDRGTPIHTLQVPAGIVQIRYDGQLTGIIARADWSPEFVIHELGSVDDVMAAAPAQYEDGAHHYLWAWIDRERGEIRSRMFANELGVPEDEATGSAAARMTEYLGRDLEITQGQGSRISTQWNPDGWVQVWGRVAPDGIRYLD